MKRALALATLIALSINVSAQEYGRPDELKGLTKVFVDTGADLKNRERILKELEKAKLNFTLLDSVEGAEIVLNFGGGKEKQLGGISTNAEGTFSTPIYRKITVGSGVVYVVKEGKARAVLSFDDEEKTVWEKKPATNFAKTFLKAYRKANGLK